MSPKTDFLNEKLIKSENLEDFLNNHENDLKTKSFSDFLYTLLEEKAIKYGQVLKEAQMPKSTAYQVLNGSRMPSRNKIFQIVLGAGFNMNETNQLLKHAGKSELYVKEKRDAVIMFAVNRQLSLLETEEILETQNCKSILSDKL